MVNYNKFMNKKNIFRNRIPCYNQQKKHQGICIFPRTGEENCMKNNEWEEFMKIGVFCLLALILCLNSSAAEFFLSEVRKELNLVEDGAWMEAIGDPLDLRTLPEGLVWNKADFPTRNLFRKLNSADPKWAYSTLPPEQYFNSDGSLKVNQKRSIWYKREVTIPPELLKNHTVHLVLGGASFKSGVIINGKSAGESMLCTLPLEFNVTNYLKPGKNEIVIAATVREGLLDLKNRIYLAPSNGGELGVRGPVRLEFRPMTAIEDVFLKTSVKNKEIEVILTLRNSGTAESEVIPEIRIRSDRDRKQINTFFSGTPVRIAPGKSKIVTLKKKWIAPILWSPESPELYLAELSLRQGDRVIDRFCREFGFREFSIRGKDFLLNGKRIVLLRNSTLYGLRTQEHLQVAGMEVLRTSHKVNSIRQHLGTSNQDMIYRANRSGMLMMPESAYSWKGRFPVEKAQFWLPGVLEYYKAWVRHFRNEPSVVIYNLTNETFWASRSPEDMAVTKKIVDTVRAEDPTRPLQGDGDNSWGGQLDIINIHYPEGQAGTLRLKYTNSGIIIPNDFDWLTPKGGKGWNTDFQWDRPLFFGEFGLGLSNDNYSSVVGDEYYSWTKWENREMAERNDGIPSHSEQNPFMEYLKQRIVHLRHAGVAGLNPWAGYFPHVLKMTQVAPLDYHANASSGELFRRNVAAFNDSNAGYSIDKIRFALYLGKDPVFSGEKKIFLKTGRKWSGTLEIPLPETKTLLKGRLIVRAIWNRGKTEVELDRFEQDLNIIPHQDLSTLCGEIAILDPKGTLNSLRSAWNLQTAQVLSQMEIPAGKKLIVIARDAWSADQNQKLDSFMENGGVVLLLPQKEWKPWRVELPERDPIHAATLSWTGKKSHPALKGLDDSFFQYWRNDNVISKETFYRPVQGAAVALLNCGGRFGLQWSPLLEIPIGKGALIATTLEFEKPDPAAQLLLANLIRYSCERKAEERVSLNLLAGKNRALKEAIGLSCVRHSEGIGKQGPILMDASADWKPQVVESLLRAGRTLWLHGVTPDTLNKLKGLLPEGITAEKAPKGILAPEVITTDPLTDGITAFDLAWYRRSWMSNKTLFENAIPNALPGSWILKSKYYAGDALKLTTPAFLMKIPVGSGTLLLDTLEWEKALGKEPQKALRVLSTILGNLDCAFQFRPKVSYRYGSVDLRPFANMGFMDSKRGDGVGGWTDDGRSDMRFFLINHAGTGNGEEDGMAVDEETFPELVRFHDVPFRLIDPKKNNGRSVLSFGSAKVPSIRMRETGAIPVHAKADFLWLLHATAWGGDRMKAAEYEVTYEDGTRTTFPVVNFVDVGDWFHMQQYSNCKIAWTGKNLISDSVGLFMAPWKNPHPEKAIRELRIKAGLSDCAYVLVAIATATKETENSSNGLRKQVYAQFDFSKDPSSSLELLPHKKSPEKVDSGIRTGKGTFLLYRPTPPLREMLKKPFGIVLEFTATDKPDGYCAGLFEPSSFRITLNRYSMKFTVETFDQAGKRVYFSSRDPVTLNKRVRFELRADGRRMILYRDGKLDTIKELPLPMKDLRTLRFGVAGGKEYNFNGIFHSAELYAIQP